MQNIRTFLKDFVRPRCVRLSQNTQALNINHALVSMKKHHRSRYSSPAIAVLIATVALGAPVESQSAKPSPPSAKGAGFLCRADFNDDDLIYRVVSDGNGHCPQDVTDSGSWDYWSSHVDHGLDPACGGNGGAQNDVQSNGGRWIFSTGLTERWIRVKWTGALVSLGQKDARVPEPAEPNLDLVIYDSGEGPADETAKPDPAVDHLSVRIAADNLFAPGVTRHSLTIEIFEISAYATGRTWSLVYTKPLYVVQDDPLDPRLVCLTTGSDADLAELRHMVKPGRFTTIGTYKLPLSIFVGQTDIPTQ